MHILSTPGCNPLCIPPLVLPHTCTLGIPLFALIWGFSALTSLHLMFSDRSMDFLFWVAQNLPNHYSHQETFSWLCCAGSGSLTFSWKMNWLTSNFPNRETLLLLFVAEAAHFQTVVASALLCIFPLHIVCFRRAQSSKLGWVVLDSLHTPGLLYGIYCEVGRSW